MIDIKTITNIYFIGIGGIGMSALARYFHAKGATVSGYDKTKTALTEQLNKEGISVHYEEDVTSIPLNPDVVVYTPAIPTNNKEFIYCKENNFLLVKRSDVLQWITANSFNICVSGTHGKTTTSTMIAHILRHSGFGCSAFLGGIAANYGTNFWSSDNNVVVVEADEYDRSFLKLHPNLAIVTAVDADHLDIYGTAAAVEEAFVAFTHQVKNEGSLLYHASIHCGNQLNKGVENFTYSLNNTQADVYAKNISVQQGAFHFSAQTPKGLIADLQLHMGGMHNIENALAAIWVAKQLGIDNYKIQAAIASFKGVKRRFEMIVNTDKHTLIDDYAHHPAELNALIEGVRTLFPNKKFVLVFQPHLFTRTRDFGNDFARVLQKADQVILLPIYPARELPIPGVDSAWLASKMPAEKTLLMNKEALLQWVNVNQPELIVTAGAGDIDQLVEPLKNILMH